jgi:hypothetical protein
LIRNNFVEAEDAPFNELGTLEDGRSRRGDVAELRRTKKNWISFFRNSRKTTKTLTPKGTLWSMLLWTRRGAGAFVRKKNVQNEITFFESTSSLEVRSFF